MTPLPIKFSRSTFTYRQVCRFGSVALYRKHPVWGEKPPTLEVVRLRPELLCDASFTVGDPSSAQLTHYRAEVYPHAQDYGKHLFPASDEADAFGIMAALLLV